MKYIFIIVFGFWSSCYANDEIYHTANSMLGYSSQDIPHTNGGRLACAAMVNKIVKKSVGYDFKTCSTEEMYQTLRKDKKWQRLSLNNLEPGSIIISPSNNKVSGHVGIVVANNKIYSNDSRRRRFAANYTLETWKRYFRDKKGLGVYVFKFV